MDSDENILHTLKYGSKEEVGKAITVISRLKDPKYNSLLKNIMHSDDDALGVMAAYALAETGDKGGADFIEKILHSNPTMFVPPEKLPDFKTLERILNLPDALISATDSYNRSHFVDSRHHLLDMLDIYRTAPVTTRIPHFDNLVLFTFTKTRGLILDALAICEFHLGNIEDSLKYSLEAVTIAEEVQDPQLLKISYADLAHIHMALGNYYSALELLHKSLDIDESSNDPWRKRNRALSNLALLYYQIGRLDKTLEYGQEALTLSEKEKDIYGSARCLNVIGVVSSNTGDFHSAREYLQKALDLSEKELNDKALQSIILNNLAYVYYSLSKSEKAKEFLSQALELAVQMSDKSTEAGILSSMAMVKAEAGAFGEAERCAEAALNLCRTTYNLSGQAEANYILGSIHDFGYDNPEAAYGYYEEAVDISETMWENLVLDDFKISFAADRVALYRQMVALCIRMGKIEEAFEYIERSKSRALVDMLSSASDAIRVRAVSPEKQEEIAKLRTQLDFLRKQMGSILSDKKDAAEDARHKDLEIELAELERDYVRTFEDIKLEDPEWASLLSVDVVDLGTAQAMMDEGTLLIEFYQSGDSELNAVVFGARGAPLTVRISVDTEVEAARLFDLLLSLSGAVGGDTRSHDYIRKVKQPLSYFYDLLISPLRELMRDIEHIIIIPHSFWHYLPFHALFDSKSGEYLIDQVSMSYAPSATALNLCCKKNDNTYETALVLANPSDDLPYAEEEAEKIKAKFGGNGFLFRSDMASPDKLSEHSDVDVLHVACHGYFRGDEPLFSHLVLADEEGGTAPFFLPDIFNLRLKASLVTLSACETGLGQLTDGDELIGMSRAFFYAGTSTLLTSLWMVNDRSTASLMDRFYEGLINKGESKADALRNAIQELKAAPEYGHPYFWAPFFLSGDWR